MKILKALLLWITAISSVLLVCSVDSLNWSFLLSWTILNMFLIFWCYAVIRNEELKELSGMNLLNKLLENGKEVD